MPTTFAVIAGLEFEDDELDTEHNLDLFIIGSGRRRRCGELTLATDPTAVDLPDLTDDRSIRHASGQYSFTFGSEGNFVVTLQRPVSEIEQIESTNQSPLNARRDDDLAMLQIAVFGGKSKLV
jgi:hypothetical protein